MKIKIDRLVKSFLVDWVTTILFFLLALTVFFKFYSGFPEYLINDTGVEILQVRYFHAWPLETFIPPYPNARVEEIESFYGYYMKPFIALLGDSYQVFHLAVGIFFALTVEAFYQLLRRLFVRLAAVLGTLAYATSAYTVWWSLLLLRNSFAPFFVMSVLIGLIDVLQGHYRRGAMLTIVGSALGVFTYTSLKAVLCMLIISAFLSALILRRRQTFIAVAVTGVSTLVLVLLMAWFSGSLNELFYRGTWMQSVSDFGQHKTLANYLDFYFRTLLLPVYQNSAGFLAEPTHAFFGRSILPWGIMGLLWCSGLLIIFYQSIKRNSIAVFVLLSIFLAPAILCVAGPSLKTALCLAPIIFLCMTFTLDALLRVLPSQKPYMFILLFGGLLFNFRDEAHFMLTEVKVRNSHNSEVAGQLVGQYLIDHDQEFDVVVFHVKGFELVNMIYPAWQEKTIGIDELSDRVLIETKKALEVHDPDRVWVILSPDASQYKELISQYNMCFDREIWSYAHLLKSCHAHKQ